ncbi:hypothetical protein [Pleionea sediminis]|uniref:hypothetical protein n=1 Tax=Pleionea sediminis TaxID=2569479 RepID=UPI0011856481|nr:hypothetical protein [Pleionea sediminis]
MSNNVINISVNTSDSQSIIVCLAEYKYREVYQAIDLLKQNLKIGSGATFVDVQLDASLARNVLAELVKRPFCDVYKLVGTINEQLDRLAENEFRHTSSLDLDATHESKGELANKLRNNDPLSGSLEGSEIAEAEEKFNAQDVSSNTMGGSMFDQFIPQRNSVN